MPLWEQFSTGVSIDYSEQMCLNYDIAGLFRGYVMLGQDEIVPIPEHRVKFFGTRGKMLLPSPNTVATAIVKIPASKVITTNLLRQHLLEQFEVDAVCPVTTKKALSAIAKDPDNVAPYWRVINQNGNVISNLPNAAEKLRADGVTIAADGKKVANYKAMLTGLN
jgi:hypothetical protein